MPLPENVATGELIESAWGNDVVDTLETHETRTTSLEGRTTTVEGRATALEGRATALERSMAWATVTYAPVTIADFAFPYLNISAFTESGGLVSQVSANSVQLTRAAAVTLSAMLPAGPGAGGPGFACLLISVNGAAAASTRQYLPASTHGHLSCSTTYEWGASSTIQIQFGAVYSSGMSISVGEAIVPTLNVYEIGLP